MALLVQVGCCEGSRIYIIYTWNREWTGRVFLWAPSLLAMIGSTNSGVNSRSVWLHHGWATHGDASWLSYSWGRIMVELRAASWLSRGEEWWMRDGGEGQEGVAFNLSEAVSDPASSGRIMAELLIMPYFYVRGKKPCLLLLLRDASGLSYSSCRTFYHYLYH